MLDLKGNVGENESEQVLDLKPVESGQSRKQRVIKTSEYVGWWRKRANYAVERVGLVRLVSPAAPWQPRILRSLSRPPRLHPCRLAVRWTPCPTWPRCTSTPSARLPLREQRCLGQTQQRGAVIHRRARDCLRAHAALRQMAHVKGPLRAVSTRVFHPLLRATARAHRNQAFCFLTALQIGVQSLCLDVVKHQAPHKLMCLTFPQGAPAESRI